MNASNGMQDFACSIVESVRHPMVALDVHLKVIAANTLFYQLVGAPPERILGNSLYEIDDDRSAQRFSDPVRATLARHSRRPAQRSSNRRGRRQRAPGAVGDRG